MAELRPNLCASGKKTKPPRTMPALPTDVCLRVSEEWPSFARHQAQEGFSHLVCDLDRRLVIQLALRARGQLPTEATREAGKG